MKALAARTFWVLLLASVKFDWGTLIANCETLAIDYEQVEDIATNDQRDYQQMNRP